MKQHKKVWLTALVVVAVIFNAWSGVSSKKIDIVLNNGQIAFKVSPRKIVFSYLLNGKQYPAVTLLPEINGGKGAMSYTVTQISADKQSATLNVASANGRHGSLQFTFGASKIYLKLAKFSNIGNLKINFNSVALVLPDQRSEDLVVYPAEWQQSTLIIPGDNHLLLNMLDKGNSMLSCLWNSESIKLTERKAVDGKSFTGLNLQPRRGDVLWLGLNAAKNIWTMPTETITRKVTPIAWKPPFPALWRLTLQKGDSDLKAENNQCDSWNLADLDAKKPKSGLLGVGIQNQDGKTWASGLGSFVYPFTEKKGKISVSYPRYREVRNSYNDKYQPLIYPVKSQKQKSSGQLLPYDALGEIVDSKTLETLHNVRSKKSRYPATCGITAKVEKIFYREEDKKSKAIIEKHFKRMNFFVLYNRQRIQEYGKWGKKISKQLNAYGKKHPESVKLIKSLRKDLYQMNVLYAKVRDKIKKPAYCKMLTDKVETLIDSGKDGETKEEECKQFGRQIRIIGGKQDHLVADLRYVTKAFRMRVTLLLLENKNPTQRKMLEAMRHETTKIMHLKFPMEGK
jgi:hypothetical protein